jgi:hypothetical protein
MNFINKLNVLPLGDYLVSFSEIQDVLENNLTACIDIEKNSFDLVIILQP